MKRLWQMAVLMAFLVLLDQLTKGAVQSLFYPGESIPVIEGLFRLTYVQNTGAAWGMGASLTGLPRLFFLLLLPVGACVWLFSLIVQERNGSFLLSLAYSLILAGACGNLIDRFTLGFVVDFFDVHWGHSHFPAFNVADSSISVGAGLIVASSFKRRPKTKV